MSRTAKKWRVAVITPRFTTVGGGERYCVETCRRIAEAPDIELTVVCEKQVEPVPHIRFIEVGRREFPRFLKKKRFAKKVQQVLEREKFDLVHSNEQVPGAHVCSLHGTPHETWIRQVQGKGKLSWFDKNKVQLERDMLAHPDCKAILPVSTLVREIYEEAYDFSGKWVDYAPPGVDGKWLADQSSAEEARSNVRKKLNIAADEFVVGFVSMNWPHKGLDLLVEAVSKMEAPATLLVVGKGNDAFYAQRAQEAGVKTVFAGVVRDGIEELYAASDVFALPSKWDAFAMVVCEAMALSLPVLISDTVGARDVVDQGVNGFVLDRSDIAAWTEHLGLLAGNCGKLQCMKRAARRTAESLSWQHPADVILKTYRDLLG